MQVMLAMGDVTPPLSVPDGKRDDHIINKECGCEGGVLTTKSVRRIPFVNCMIGTFGFVIRATSV
jgi:hypothetical protein